MKSSRFASAFVAILLLAPALFAAEDLTGTWTGSFVISMDGGTPSNDTAYMVLKHAGKELTGTAGPNADQQWAISKGTVAVAGAAGKETTKASFVVQPGEGSGPPMQFELELIAGHLKGSAKAEQDGMKLSAVLDMTRVK
jgi:hypothetical protein